MQEKIKKNHVKMQKKKSENASPTRFQIGPKRGSKFFFTVKKFKSKFKIKVPM